MRFSLLAVAGVGVALLVSTAITFGSAEPRVVVENSPVFAEQMLRGRASCAAGTGAGDVQSVVTRCAALNKVLDGRRSAAANVRADAASEPTYFRYVYGWAWFAVRDVARRLPRDRVGALCCGEHDGDLDHRRRQLTPYGAHAAGVGRTIIPTRCVPSIRCTSTTFICEARGCN